MLRLPPLAGRVAVMLLLLLMAAAPSFSQQKGKASYYSRRANGNRTSSGTRLNNDSLVCAHRTHPFGTLLDVKNPASGKQVVVKVIDRGPHTRGRVIDLSFEAARRLGILAAGVALVEVSVHEDFHVPFKIREEPHPELELELPAPEEDFGIKPEWQRDREKKEKAETKHTTATAKHHTAKAETPKTKEHSKNKQQQ
jgi:rare lipoprotein A